MSSNDFASLTYINLHHFLFSFPYYKVCKKLFKYKEIAKIPTPLDSINFKREIKLKAN